MPEGGFQDDLKKQVLETAKQEVLRRVEALKCPVHGQHPRRRKEIHQSDRVDFDFDCCCKALAEMIQKELK